MNARAASFTRAERLKRPSDFRFVLRNGKKFREGWLSVYQVPARTSESRIGIMVNGRLVRSAVDRNRIKRLTREFFRLNKHRFRQNFDIIVRAEFVYNSINRNDLQKTLKALFNNAGIMAD